MEFQARRIQLSDTGFFSPLVLDYIDQVAELMGFYTHSADFKGISDAIAIRERTPTDRKALVDQLNEQYTNSAVTAKVQANIDLLLEVNTFTITTAHQPNIFTGHLYFIYKILHAIKLAETLKMQIPGKNFVPVYYMGSEDADLDELGEVSINGQEYRWTTDQKGAVGRMKIDKAFIDIIKAIDGQISVEKHGMEIMELVKDAYSLDKTIQQATFDFSNELFGAFGLVVLMPDCAALKDEFSAIALQELEEKFSHKAVATTITEFPAKYRVQAAGRDINLFYLKDDIRERIEETSAGFKVANTNIIFTKEELKKEISTNPERISPNVILRPVFQELILPNIAFIGGGGELAYWLELKKVFDTVAVPFPVLILRNSFAIVNAKTKINADKLNLGVIDFFQPENNIVNLIVKRDAEVKLSFADEKLNFIKLYRQLRDNAKLADPTLEKHVWSLQATALQKIDQLEKKMLKATRKQFEAQRRQIRKIREEINPNNTLQERVENILPYYAVYGHHILDLIYAHCDPLGGEFCILSEKNDR